MRDRIRMLEARLAVSETRRKSAEGRVRELERAIKNMGPMASRAARLAELTTPAIVALREMDKLAQDFKKAVEG